VRTKAVGVKGVWCKSEGESEWRMRVSMTGGGSEEGGVRVIVED